MSAPVDPKGLDEALHAHFTADGDDVSQMEAAISAYLTATQPGEVEAGIVGRLHKRADLLGILLSDPPKPHPDAVLMREAAAALTAALRGRDEAKARTWDWPSDPRTDNLNNQLAAAKRDLNQAREALTAAEERGRAAERERCARIVEEMPDYLLADLDRPGNGYRKTTRGDIAAAIRKGTP